MAMLANNLGIKLNTLIQVVKDANELKMGKKIENILPVLKWAERETNRKGNRMTSRTKFHLGQEVLRKIKEIKA